MPQHTPRDQTRSPDHRVLLKADEVAETLSLGRTKVYEMMNAAQLPVIRIGTAGRVPLKELMAG